MTHYKENEEGDETNVSMRMKAGSAEDLNLLNRSCWISNSCIENVKTLSVFDPKQRWWKNITQSRLYISKDGGVR